MESEQQHQKKEKLFEKEVLEVALFTFVGLFLLFGVFYKFYFSALPDFTTKYLWYFFYTIIVVIANATAIYHLKAYRNAVTCMTGMMIGMTIGMITGFSLGYLVGATNGMFIGTVYGILLGVVVGIWCGKCCGIMGIMEGAMAGLMGGSMGAMLSVMMLSDHILLFTPFFILVCIGILFGLGHIVFKEHALSEEKIIKPYPLSLFFVICFIVTTITILLMLYGPKSILVS